MGKPQHTGMKGRDVGADGRMWYTRRQAAEYLKMTVPAIKYHERRGRLRFRLLEGVHIFAKAELDAFATHGVARKDYLAAEAFKLLDAGATPATLVTELRISPELATDFGRQYRKLSAFDLDP